MRRVIIVGIIVLGVYLLVKNPQVVRTAYHRTVGRWTAPQAVEISHPDEVKVFLPRNARFYHRKGCPDIGTRTAVPTPVGRARELARPCPTCQPPR